MTQQGQVQPQGTGPQGGNAADQPPRPTGTAEPGIADSSAARLPANPQSEMDPPQAALVPVTESIRYRRRAQQAERKAAELQQQLDEQRIAAAKATAELAVARRRAELTRLLAARGVIDLEAAILLAEQRLPDALPNALPDPLGETPAADGNAADLAATIEQLLKDKPYLLAGDAAAGDQMRGGEQVDAASGRAQKSQRQAAAATSSPATPTLPPPTLPSPTQGRRTAAGPAEVLRTAARRAATTGRGTELDNYLKMRRRFR